METEMWWNGDAAVLCSTSQNVLIVFFQRQYAKKKYWKFYWCHFCQVWELLTDFKVPCKQCSNRAVRRGNITTDRIHARMPTTCSLCLSFEFKSSQIAVKLLILFLLVLFCLCSLPVCSVSSRLWPLTFPIDPVKRPTHLAHISKCWYQSLYTNITFTLILFFSMSDCTLKK